MSKRCRYHVPFAPGQWALCGTVKVKIIEARGDGVYMVRKWEADAAVGDVYEYRNPSPYRELTPEEIKTVNLVQETIDTIEARVSGQRQPSSRGAASARGCQSPTLELDNPKLMNDLETLFSQSAAFRVFAAAHMGSLLNYFCIIFGRGYAGISNVNAVTDSDNAAAILNAIDNPQLVKEGRKWPTDDAIVKAVLQLACGVTKCPIPLSKLNPFEIVQTMQLLKGVPHYHSFMIKVVEAADVWPGKPPKTTDGEVYGVVPFELWFTSTAVQQSIALPEGMTSPALVHEWHVRWLMVNQLPKQLYTMFAIDMLQLFVDHPAFVDTTACAKASDDPVVVPEALVTIETDAEIINIMSAKLPWTLEEKAEAMAYGMIMLGKASAARMMELGPVVFALARYVFKNRALPFTAINKRQFVHFVAGAMVLVSAGAANDDGYCPLQPTGVFNLPTDDPVGKDRVEAVICGGDTDSLFLKMGDAHVFFFDQVSESYTPKTFDWGYPVIVNTEEPTNVQLNAFLCN